MDHTKSKMFFMFAPNFNVMGILFFIGCLSAILEWIVHNTNSLKLLYITLGYATTEKGPEYLVYKDN